ncbi:MAG: alpha/beta fold hydrolase [Acidimicrobiia bacterium]|nr:alpha/beta fold hydrolase [Acidimicrobiia bacterium]
MKIDVMRQVAQRLATEGIASLRYDKRGVGESDGEYLAAGFYDNVADGRAALQVLCERSEVDPGAVVIVGHSEGALIAAELAREGDLAGVVLLAGSARPGEEVLLWQARQLAPTLPAPVRLLMRLMRQDLMKTQAKRLARIKASTDDVIRVGFVKVNAKWFREFMSHDPATSLVRATAPILAITGAKDIQVDPSDVMAMERIVSTPFVGHVPEDVTHLLRTEDGPATIRTYKKQAGRPVDAGVLGLVTGWLADLAPEPLSYNNKIEPRG